MKIKELIDGLNIPPGSTRRVDCINPSCRGKHTLSISNESGKYIYHCFKAGCTLSGATAGRFNLEHAVQSLDREKYGGTILRTTFMVPDWFVLHSARGFNGRAISVPVYKDVKEDRTVFLVKDMEGEIVDAVGRANVRGVKPKWKRYGNSRLPFICGKQAGIGVIVEDCFSACAVGDTGEYTGIALLGTSVLAGASDWISNFDGCIIALDYDATAKAIEYTKSLSWHVPTATAVLQEDLKYFQPDDIKMQLKQARKFFDAST